MFNVFSPAWDDERETGGFATAPGTRPDATVRVARVNPRIGAEKLGASFYELAPGAVQSPVHLHHANEEILVVLSGRPTMRTPDGTRQLEPGDVVACQVGRRGAHRIENLEAEPCRVLMVCTSNFPDVIEHLGIDDERVIVVTAPPFANAERSDGDLTLSFSRADANRPSPSPAAR